MDHRLRNSIVEGIRQAANSSLTVTDTTGETGASTIGKRQGPWFHDGHLRWNISRLPARTRTAIEQVVSELHPETPPEPRERPNPKRKAERPLSRPPQPTSPDPGHGPIRAQP